MKQQELQGCSSLNDSSPEAYVGLRDAHTLCERYLTLESAFFAVWVKKGEDVGHTRRSCVKVEAAVLGSPSLTVLLVPVDVKQH